MANDRLSQLAVEVLELPQPKGRMSQLAVESLILPQPKARLSQYAVEVLMFPYEIHPPLIDSTAVLFTPTLAKSLRVPFLNSTAVLFPPTIRHISVNPPRIGPTTHLFAPRLVRPLAMLVAPTISGTAIEGQMVEASPGVWSGTPPFVFAFQWLRCNSGGTACVDIPGATASVYIVQAADVGGTLRVRVIASDSSA